MTKRLTTEEFQNRLDEYFGKGEFIVLDEYVNNSTKLRILHTKCNNIIYKRPAKMIGLEHEGCYICAGKNCYKTKEVLQKEVDERYPGKYNIIDDYINARTPILVENLECGHKYMISPDNLLRGKGCPKCGIRHSSYMQIVEDYLDNHGIQYVKEKRFDDCVNVRPLPFDYYIESMNTCIEVDGEFHYRVNSVYKNNRHAEYEEVMKRDNIKTNYCQKNNIKLIRLPYFEKDNFESILDKELHVNT